ncbi:MAG TPA: enolase C-terminal domain-like protein [Bryobacteraceae bacterium]|nr:enolase C-terminal domain-like protein [Bryobacteraceae bacterium]
MNRRGVLRMIAGSAAAGLTSGRHALAQEKAAKAVRGMPSPKIKDVSLIATQPAGARLSVVKIVTDQDGLYGYGCSTFTQRAELVNLAVEKYLKPLLLGKPTDRIEDTWQMCYDSSYWRNGPVLNNAISGVDEALWDIKGRQAGMPVYDLWGGKCREAAQMFANAGGAEPKDVVEGVRQAMARGYKHVRVSTGVRGGGGRGGAGGGDPEGGGGRAAGSTASARGLHEGPVFDRAPALRRMLDVFAACRKELGFEVELMHDMHERYEPRQAIQFVKDCEQFKLYFLEDPLSPEDNDWFREMRAQSSTPIAMGELFNSPHEWTPLITGRLIDFIRCHLSQVGGVSVARKIALLAEPFGVKTAWHGPGDVSPVGHTAQLHLDLASYNFGIQEGGLIGGVSAEIFKGCATFKDGYLWANAAPGWGIEVDEKLAAKYPYGTNEQGERGRLNGGWGDLRSPDGTVIKQ